MPTYAYQCKDCGHAFDIVQSFSDDSLTQCRQCTGRLRKKFGNVGVTFKGSGFYRTDSRSGKAAQGSSAGSGSSSGTESTTPAKTSSSSSQPAGASTSSGTSTT